MDRPRRTKGTSHPIWDALTIGGREFFAYADRPTIRRLCAVLWVAGTIVTFGLFAISPPSNHVGAFGWLVVAGVTAVAAALVVRCVRQNVEVSDWELLGGSWFALAAIGVLDVLAQERLYARTLLLSVVFVGATQPPRRWLLFFPAAVLVSAQPVIAGYDGARIDSVLGDAMLWLVISIVVIAWTTSVHAQRRQAAHATEHAHRQARVDDLTGLPNRRAFDEAVGRELARAQRGATPLTLAIVDLDDFKSVNDTHGHLAGDQVLRSVGAALATNSRGEDQWFRWGGDEFVGLLIDADEDQAGHVLRRLEAALATTCIRPEGAPVALQVGLAQLDVAMGRDELLGVADAAVLRAKAAC